MGVGGALWLALALCVAAPAFAAVGALASQLAASRREAAALAGAVFVAAFMLRVAADGSATLGWLRWLTPLGWIEELRPLTGDRVLALLPLVALDGHADRRRRVDRARAATRARRCSATATIAPRATCCSARRRRSPCASRSAASSAGRSGSASPPSCSAS